MKLWSLTPTTSMIIVVITPSEVVQRLLADTCELCGSHDSVEVHHVRHLRDLHTKGRAQCRKLRIVFAGQERFWVSKMA